LPCNHMGHGVTGETKEATWERLVMLGKLEHPDEVADFNGEMEEERKKMAFEVMDVANAENNSSAPTN